MMISRMCGANPARTTSHRLKSGPQGEIRLHTVNARQFAQPNTGNRGLRYGHESYLDFPGGAPRISRTIDYDILARAIAWAGDADPAQNEVFNVTNRDFFSWQSVWPALARALGMEHGGQVPASLSETMPAKSAIWGTIRQRDGLLSPAMNDFVGKSFQLTDYTFRYGITEPEDRSHVDATEPITPESPTRAL
jgi:hypothetical protein